LQSGVTRQGDIRALRQGFARFVQFFYDASVIGVIDRPIEFFYTARF